MHPDVVNGIQERVDEFMRQCEAAGEQAMDIYVRIIFALVTIEKANTIIGLFALLCDGLRYISSSAPPRDEIHRGKRYRLDERVLIWRQSTKLLPSLAAYV